MEKLLELLKVGTLNEDQQKEIKEVLSTIIESKAEELSNDKVEKLLEEEKEKLTEDFDKKFDTYKDDVTSKFSNFVDTILEEEMVIPEKLVKYAHLGEMYNDLIEQFKLRLALDEGLLDNEVKKLLEEAKEEIITLKEQVNELTKDKLTLEKDAQEMAAHIYLREKCDGLTESQKKHVLSLLDDVVIKEEIDKKFQIIVESMKDLNLNEKEDEDDKDDKKENDKDTMTYECPECGNVEEIKEGDDTKCPECGKAMKKATKNEGKGSSETDNKNNLNENEDTPWAQTKEAWLKVMKKGL